MAMQPCKDYYLYMGLRDAFIMNTHIYKYIYIYIWSKSPIYNVTITVGEVQIT